MMTTTTTTTNETMNENAIDTLDKLDPFYEGLRDQTRVFVQMGAIPFLTVIGIVGNLITVVAMTRRTMRSTTNLYLAALAVVDMLYLLLSFLLGLNHYPNMSDPKYAIYWHCRPYMMMLTDGCSNSSVWLTVAFTIERYIAVKYPMKGKIWCTESRAKLLILSIILISFSFVTPVPFEWDVIQDETKHLMDLKPSIFGQNETFRTIYYRLAAILFSFVPIISLSIFNGFLIKSVHDAKRERERMTSSQGGSARRTSGAYTTSSKQSTSNKQMVENSSYRSVEANGSPSGGGGGGFNNNSPSKMSQKLIIENPQNGLIAQSNKEMIASNFRHIPSKRFSLEITCDDTVDRKEHSNEPNTKLPEQLASSSSQKSIGGNPQMAAQANRRHSISKMASSILRNPSKLIGHNNNNNQESQDSSANHQQDQQQQQQHRQQAQQQQNQHPGSSQELRITIMLISVIILFLTCQLPTAALLLYQTEGNLKLSKNQEAVHLALGNVFNMLLAINATGNFFIYTFFSVNYRQTVLLLFCTCFKYGPCKSYHDRYYNQRGMNHSFNSGVTIVSRAGAATSINQTSNNQAHGTATGRRRSGPIKQTGIIVQSMSGKSTCDDL